MGEPAMPTAIDRAITRTDAFQIVYSVTNDEKMPLPFEWPEDPLDTACPDCPKTDVENFVFQLAQEITLLGDQLDFIGEAARRLLQAKDLTDDELQLIAEIYGAGREHKTPDWWPAFREERNARSKHG